MTKMNDDDKLFEQAMRGVKRLSEGEQRRQRPLVLPPRAAPAPTRQQHRQRPPSPRARTFGGGAAAVPNLQNQLMIEEDDDLFSARVPGIDKRVLKRLRAGDVPVDAKIDLHGKTREASMDALDRFMGRALEDGKRCVLVIHGRGHHLGTDGPVLMTATREQLIEGPWRDHVLALTSAPPERGGAGALLVLLRRSGRQVR